jgi:hypothetical protein
VALQRLDPNGLRRVLKRRRKNERRARKMENALRRHLYLRPLADLVSALARIFTLGGK